MGNNDLVNMPQGFCEKEKYFKWPSDTNGQSGFEKQDMKISRMGWLKLKGNGTGLRKVNRSFHRMKEYNH